VDALASPKITIARLSDQLLFIGTLAAIEDRVPKATPNAAIRILGLSGGPREIPLRR